MKRIRISFSLKLLVALLGSVGLLLGATLYVVRRETARQVQTVVNEATKKAEETFGEIQRVRHDLLISVGRQLALSQRILIALDEGAEAGYFKQVVDSELSIANAPDDLLLVFINRDNELILAMEDDKALSDWDPELRLDAATDSRADRSSQFKYRALRGRLYDTRAFALYNPYGRMTGSLLVAFPIDDSVAKRVGDVISADVCFATMGRCVAGTEGIRQSGIAQAMIATAGDNQLASIDIDGVSYKLISERLSLSGEADAWRVLAVPLESIRKPFNRIYSVTGITGLVVLGLAVGLGFLLSAGLARPVRALVNATKRVADGDLNASVKVNTHDELETLADSFNAMVKGLRLKEKYRGVLDKVVSRDVADELLRDIELGGENRNVTTLFADVRGFTSLTEGMEPQEVISMLNECMERMSEAVEQAGGVVDKYVGDELMALFGAPVEHEDNELRAVEAAVKMRQSITELNEDRKKRGEPEIKIGVGINSGQVVAGNMGSPSRLNYTVLGEAVNVAARLCSEARPFEILISETTYERVAEQVDAKKLEPVEVKGLSYPIQSYSVDSVSRTVDDDVEAASSMSSAAPMVMLIACLWAGIFGFGTPSVNAATALNLPTLHSLGASYMSKSGTVQVDLSGWLGIEGYALSDEAPLIIEENDSFVNARFSLFADVFVGRHVYAFAEYRADRGEAPADRSLTGRLQQGYLRLTPNPTTDIHLQVGKFATPFGAYSQRHHTPADPLIRPPLSHEYRMIICPTLAPPSNDVFLDWKWNPERFRPTGAPVIWGIPYQTGAMVFGSVSKLSYRLAVMNSAPSSEPRYWNPDLDPTLDPSYVAHLGFQVTPELGVGASYSIGPYSSEQIEQTLPEGGDLNDYDQELIGVDVTFARWRIEARGEIFWDRWEVPRVRDDAKDLSYFLEGKLKLMPGLFVAVRYNTITFNEMWKTDGSTVPWDWDVTRWQLGAGYRLGTNTEIRVEYATTRTEEGPMDPDDDLVAIQWWWAL